MLFSKQSIQINPSSRIFLLHVNWVAFTKPFKQKRITKGGELSWKRISIYMLVSLSTSLNIGLMSKHFYFDNKLAHRIWWLSKGSRRLQETKQIFQLELLLNLRRHVFWSNLLHPREIIIMVIKILHRFLFQFFCNLRCDGEIS